MKITKSELKRLVEEEIKLIKEMDGHISAGADAVGVVANQVIELLSTLDHNDAVDVLNAVAIELNLVAPEEEEDGAPVRTRPDDIPVIRGFQEGMNFGNFWKLL